jgi:hypothetical protein
MQSTSSIVLLILSLSACVFLSKQQLIDPDVNHWTRYVFAEGTATVTLKIPPGFRTINSSLPELTHKGAQRLLLDAQYDFGKGASSHTSQFEMKVNFARLVDPLDIASVNADSLDAALALAFGHPIKGHDSPRPVEESTRGRKWIYYDNTSDETYGQTRETYATLIDNTTVLLITGWYGPDIRKHAKWLDSRRLLLKEVRDHIAVSQ